MIASSVDDSTHSKCLGLETTKPEAVPCPCKTIAVECGNGEDSSTNFYFSKKGEPRHRLAENQVVLDARSSGF